MTVPTFPTLIGLTFPMGAAPYWRTLKQEAISGKEYRLQLWTYPRRKYEIVLSYLGSNAAEGQNQDWQTLTGFFNSLAGSALPFHWNDPYDNAASDAALGTGDGTTTSFNFIRSLGGFVEPLQDVTQDSVTVKVDGTPTSAFSFLTDPNFGLVYGIQFNSAPADGAALTWSGSYAWACRLDGQGSGASSSDDSLDLSNFMFNFWELKKLNFTTMKVL